MRFAIELTDRYGHLLAAVTGAALAWLLSTC